MTNKNKLKTKTENRKKRKPPTTKNATVLTEQIAARERAAYERAMHQMNQRNLPAWARDGWRPLAPGEVQEPEGMSEDEATMDRAARTQHRFAQLTRAIGNVLGTNTTDIYQGPGSRNRGRG